MATKFLRHSDELYHSFRQQTTEGGELYHYGRKGMKWGEHIFGFAGSGPEGLLLERVGKAYRDKKDREEREREERESQLKYTDGKIWTQDKEKLAAGKAQRERDEKSTYYFKHPVSVKDPWLGIEWARYDHAQSPYIYEARTAKERAKAGHAHYNAQQNSKNEQAGMNKMYAEQDRQRQQRKREELVKSANRNVKEKRYNEKIGMNKVREEQARQKQLREEKQARAASSARRNADLNAHNARLGMEKARAEQERQARERRNRKRLSSAVSRNAQYYNKRRPARSIGYLPGKSKKV